MIEHELVSPHDSTTWGAYHEIRRRVLFEARGRFGVYDANHPDETLDGNYPKVLVWRREPIGVLRIDIDGSVAFIRRVAIREDMQQRGHGRAMLRLAEAFASRFGCVELRSDVAPDAEQFYCKIGFERAVVESGEQGASNSIPMRKGVEAV